jgi:hypothetical protein
MYLKPFFGDMRSSGRCSLPLFLLALIVTSAGCRYPGSGDVGVFDESPQKVISIEVVDHTMTVSERDKNSVIAPAVTEKLAPQLSGKKIVRVEVNRLEKTGEFTNFMTCMTCTPLLGAPFKHLTYTADVSLFISSPGGLTVGPYRSTKNAREDGGLFQKVDPQRGVAAALRKAVDDAAYRAAKDKKKIMAALGSGTAGGPGAGSVGQNQYPPSDIDDVPDFGAKVREDDVAIVIGIENYRRLPASEFSRNDARLMREYLKALGFQERNIEYLTDDQATYGDIKKAVERWLPNRVQPDSSVFIYYSGHGAPDPATGDAYLVPYDGDPNYIGVTGYPLKMLYENVGKMRVKEITVVLDSCFSGAGGRSVLAKNARPLVMTADAPVLSSNVIVLSAAEGSQISTAMPEKGHGVLTYYFLKALREGKQSLAEIYVYLKPRVESEAKSLNVEQTPRLLPGVNSVRDRFLIVK